MFQTTDELLDRMIENEKGRFFNWRDYVKDNMKLQLNLIETKMKITVPDENKTEIEKLLNLIADILLAKK